MKQTNIEKLIEELKEQIKFDEDGGQDLDAKSYGYEEGILLTTNEAKLIVKSLSQESDWVSVEDVKEAFSEYFASEGCGCCSNSKKHDIAENKIGKLLNYPRYKDDSGYDFSLPNKPKQ